MEIHAGDQQVYYPVGDRGAFMIPNLPDLQFLKLEDIFIHEHHDIQRTPPLIERIRESGLFRNPPIVSPLLDRTRRYIVLDGANRITALKEMGFPDVLVQVVQPDDPGLKLENWNHVLWDMTTKNFLTGIRDISNINLIPTPDNEMTEPNLWTDCGLALLQVLKGNIYTICTPAEDLETRVSLLNAIVDSYKEKAHIDRTSMRNVNLLEDVYPDFCGLVIFPQFQINEVMSLAGAGCLLPAGITRFTISPRALHVNYPLYELAADKSLEEKNAALQEWVQKKLARKGVRYYAEATFLFDE